MLSFRFLDVLTFRVSFIVGTATTGANSGVTAGAEGAGSAVGVGATTKPGLITLVLTKVSVGVGSGEGAVQVLLVQPSAPYGFTNPAPYRFGLFRGLELSAVD